MKAAAEVLPFMASLQRPDILLTSRCRQQMQADQIAIEEILETLNTPKCVRKANPASLTDSVWRAETNGIRTYYRWSSRDGKWIILSCWPATRKDTVSVRTGNEEQ